MVSNIDTNFHARRIALIKPSALGDIVHALPVLAALRQRFPLAHLTWIVNQSYASLLENHPDLNAVLPFDRGALRGGWLSSAWGFVKFLQQIRRRHFDLVIDLQGLLRTGLMTWASRAPLRIGLRSAREGARWCYNHVVDDSGPNVHAVDRYWLVAEALGIGDIPKRFHLPLNPVAAQWANEQLDRMPRPWTMMNVGTRWETKRWPTNYFADLGRRALHTFGGTVVLVGGPDEVLLAEVVRCAVPQPVLDLTGRTSLPQLVAILAQADVVVSNDSGPLHLAAALCRPVVAPFTCTSPLRTGPYGMLSGAVPTTVWCAASYRKTCDRMDCMKELTPDRLWPLLKALLEPWQRRSA